MFNELKLVENLIQLLDDTDMYLMTLDDAYRMVDKTKLGAVKPAYRDYLETLYTNRHLVYFVIKQLEIEKARLKTQERIIKALQKHYESGDIWEYLLPEDLSSYILEINENIYSIHREYRFSRPPILVEIFETYFKYISIKFLMYLEELSYEHDFKEKLNSPIFIDYMRCL
jgi:hypothetical protein